MNRLMTKTLGSLRPNEKNPRKASDEKVEMLRHTLSEFGDLSGFVYNRKSKQLVGGHQRQKALPDDAKILITKKYDQPTKKGTVAVGYVLVRGERFAYREVEWGKAKELQANIAANKGAGDWDEKLLSEMMREIDGLDADLDLTLFDENERADLLVATREPNFEEGSEDDQGKLDEKKKAVCPHCGESFTVAGRA